MPLLISLLPAQTCSGKTAFMLGHITPPHKMAGALHTLCGRAYPPSPLSQLLLLCRFFFVLDADIRSAKSCTHAGDILPVVSLKSTPSLVRRRRLRAMASPEPHVPLKPPTEQKRRDLEPGCEPAEGPRMGRHKDGGREERLVTFQVGGDHSMSRDHIDGGAARVRRQWIVAHCLPHSSR